MAGKAGGIMFGVFRRAKALSVSKALLQQTLATLTWFGRTVPGTIYEDPYVLGYLVGMAHFAIKLATQEKLSMVDQVRVALEAIHATAGANGRVAAENSVRFSSEKNEFFREGHRQAIRISQVADGQLGPNDDPEIARVFSQAAEMSMGGMMLGSSDPKAQAAAILERKYFNEYVRTNHR
jgi:hypothetical protein